MNPSLKKQKRDHHSPLEHETPLNDWNHSLFHRSDLFQRIMMSGFLPLHDVLHHVRLVCKLWNDHVESGGWNVFHFHVLVQIFQLKIPERIISSQQQQEQLPNHSAKNTLMLFFSILKACREIRMGLEHLSFNSFLDFSIFETPRTTHEKELFQNEFQEELNSMEENLASQFLSDKFYKSWPHVSSPRKNDVLLTWIPNFLNGKQNYWTNLNCDQWFTRPFQSLTDKNDNLNQTNHLLLLLEIKSLLWVQRTFERGNYKEFFFDMVLHLEGGMLDHSKNLIEKLFLVKAVDECTIEKAEPVILETPLMCSNTKFDYVSLDSTFETETRHAICQHVTCFSKYSLTFIDLEFVNDFQSLDMLMQGPIPNDLDSFFNQKIEQILYRLWSTGLLNVKFIRNFIFKLLLALAHKRNDWYSLSFHDHIQDSCSHAQATKGVTEWFNEYLRNKQSTTRNNNTEECHEEVLLQTFVKDHEFFQGYHEGEKIQSYMLVLTLQPNFETQTCSFQVLKYLFYEYSIHGEIMS